MPSYPKTVAIISIVLASVVFVGGSGAALYVATRSTKTTSVDENVIPFTPEIFDECIERNNTEIDVKIEIDYNRTSEDDAKNNSIGKLNHAILKQESIPTIIIDGKQIQYKEGGWMHKRSDIYYIITTDSANISGGKKKKKTRRIKRCQKQKRV
jgi:hypothetical protein